MTDLLEGDYLLVVLRDDPFDPPSVLPAEAVAQPLEAVPELRVLPGPLPDEAARSLEPFLREGADQGRGVDRV